MRGGVYVPHPNQSRLHVCIADGIVSQRAGKRVVTKLISNDFQDVFVKRIVNFTPPGERGLELALAVMRQLVFGRCRVTRIELHGRSLSVDVSELLYHHIVQDLTHTGLVSKCAVDRSVIYFRNSSLKMYNDRKMKSSRIAVNFHSKPAFEISSLIFSNVILVGVILVGVLLPFCRVSLRGNSRCVCVRGSGRR